MNEELDFSKTELVSDTRTPVQLRVGEVLLSGDLFIPHGANGVAIFAHGSGSSRLSPRNRFVAEILNKNGLGTLLVDLLTPEEERIDEVNAQLRFNIPMLAERLAEIADQVHGHPDLMDLPIGYFGASTGGGAALMAAVFRPTLIHAVVSRGGRPDLAARYLPSVKAPTLLLVGEDDQQVIAMNQEAQSQMSCVNHLQLISGATHLFEEPGALDEVAKAAGDWFLHYFAEA